MSAAGLFNPFFSKSWILYGEKVPTSIGAKEEKKFVEIANICSKLPTQFTMQEEMGVWEAEL